MWVKQKTSAKNFGIPESFLRELQENSSSFQINDLILEEYLIVNKFLSKTKTNVWILEMLWYIPATQKK